MLYPSKYTKQVIKDFMPRLKGKSPEALFQVLSAGMKRTAAVDTYGGTRQGLDKNIKRFEKISKGIQDYRTLELTKPIREAIAKQKEQCND